ncbi:uncharacterized protein [Salminus brasiliensis]|uniref:uncharacterized protein n=1 Tax=Salminus brasiliensis TaxID=930266 RepID=UPI003B82D623
MKPSEELNGLQLPLPWRVDALPELSVGRKRLSKRLWLKELEEELRRERETRGRMQEEWMKERNEWMKERETLVQLHQAERRSFQTHLLQETAKLAMELQREKQQMEKVVEEVKLQLLQETQKEFEKEKEKIRMEVERYRRDLLEEMLKESERGKEQIRMEAEKERAELMEELQQLEKKRKKNRKAMKIMRHEKEEMARKVQELEKEIKTLERLKQTRKNSTAWWKSKMERRNWIGWSALRTAGSMSSSRKKAKRGWRKSGDYRSRLRDRLRERACRDRERPGRLMERWRPWWRKWQPCHLVWEAEDMASEEQTL